MTVAGERCTVCDHPDKDHINQKPQPETMEEVFLK